MKKGKNKLLKLLLKKVKLSDILSKTDSLIFILILLINNMFIVINYYKNTKKSILSIDFLF